MSLHYLLDGYNIIKQISELAPKKLEDARRELVRLIEVYQPQGSLHNSITIVFDGQPGMLGHSHSSIVKVVFAEGESADDKIKRMVEASSLRKSMVVVTNDNDIKFAVRPLGARVLSVKEFWAKIRPRSEKLGSLKNSSQAKPREEEKMISKSLEHEITSELEKLWLGKNGPKPPKKS